MRTFERLPCFGAFCLSDQTKQAIMRHPLLLRVFLTQAKLLATMLVRLAMAAQEH